MNNEKKTELSMAETMELSDDALEGVSGGSALTAEVAASAEYARKRAEELLATRKSEAIGSLNSSQEFQWQTPKFLETSAETLARIQEAQTPEANKLKQNLPNIIRY